MSNNTQHRPHLRNFATPLNLQLLGWMNRRLSEEVPRKSKQLFLGPEEAQLRMNGKESQGSSYWLN